MVDGGDSQESLSSAYANIIKSNIRVREDAPAAGRHTKLWVVGNLTFRVRWNGRVKLKLLVRPAEKVE